MAETEAEKFIARWSFAGYKARCFIQGTAKNDKTKSIEPKSGAWSEDFIDHPTVQLAEAEGWSRDLRSALFAPVRQRIMDGKPCAMINDFMPSEKWIATTRQRVAIENRAQAWQAAMMDKYGSMERYTAAVSRSLPDAQPPLANKSTTFKAMGGNQSAFDAMRGSSKNQYMHRK